MSNVLTRFLTSITLVMYLVVASVAVRFVTSETKTISITTAYATLFSHTQLTQQEVPELSVPVMEFAEIKFPVEKAPVAIKRAIVKKEVIKAPAMLAVTVPAMPMKKLAINELPFNEPVTLKPVVMLEKLPTDLVAFHKDFSFEMVAEVKDEVVTKLAANDVDAEPEFFEYSEAKVAAPETAPVTAEVQNVETVTIENNSSTQPALVHNVENVEAVEAVDNLAHEEVALDDLLAFDYSKAQEDLKQQVLPVVGTVTTQTPKVETHTQKITSMEVTEKVKVKAKAPKKVVTTQEESFEKNSLVATDKSYAVNMTIQVAGTNLDKSYPEVGFEIRYQDDLSASVQDYGAGNIIINESLAQPRMTRSLSILKLGYTPTNVDLILDEETTGVSIPMIEEEKFNSLIAPYEARGIVGAVLVELDDNTEDATLDVPFSSVLKLDGDLLVTENEDYRYKLFMGVKAGNAFLSYKDNSGTVTSRIIHIHERELTFDANYYETVKTEKVRLMEEDLLAKEKTPLVISSDAVKEFATNKTSTKINNHTYKTSFGKTLLGARRYLELNHQSEPIFVGFRDQNTLEVPSENFMRFILSQFKDSNLGNRCLVQVNLNKEVTSVEVAGESVGQGLMTSTQILDADGKFYDSVGPKSRKVIVLGENQGSPDYARDSKINFKIIYQDGSIQYLGSYCSPNTYLVEQL